MGPYVAKICGFNTALHQRGMYKLQLLLILNCDFLQCARVTKDRVREILIFGASGEGRLVVIYPTLMMSKHTVRRNEEWPDIYTPPWEPIWRCTARCYAMDEGRIIKKGWGIKVKQVLLTLYQFSRTMQ